jgi:hypothetical protein
LELNDLGYMNYADQIKNDNMIGYQITQPASIFRTYSIDLDQFNLWNFNRTFLGAGGNLNFYAEFKNNWTFMNNLIYQTAITDTRFLRGGPQMKLPFTISESGTLSTDQLQQSKTVVLNFTYGFQSRGNQSANSYSLGPGITVRPFQKLKIGMTANFTKNHDLLQYVSTPDYLSDKRYVFGTIDQNTVGLTFRVDLNITPEFSVQYYGSPFISRGSYSDLKYITNPVADQFIDRFRIYNNIILHDGIYSIDENGDRRQDYAVANPDFNFHQFRSNLVAKWEYRLGSFIYLVWSRDMTGNTGLSGASYSSSLKELMKVSPYDVFLVKLSYWFSL